MKLLPVPLSAKLEDPGRECPEQFGVSLFLSHSYFDLS
jgi:hypothetical protein